MNCKCANCGSVFDATGQAAFMVLTGGKKCPDCGGKVCLISMKRKRGQKTHSKGKNLEVRGASSG